MEEKGAGLMMRIGLNLLFLKPEIGGMRTYVYNLLSMLRNVGDLQWFTLFINKETAHDNMFQEWHTVVCPVYAKFQAIRYAWEQLILPIQVKKFRIELLHSLGYVQPLCLPCKSVITIHDLNFAHIGNLMTPLRRKVLQIFVPLSAKTADHIITVSKFSKKQIVELLGIPPEKVTVIYNAPKYPPSRVAEIKELKQRYGITLPYILALSSPSPHKNIDNLVKAFFLIKERGHRELKLVLAGKLPKTKSKLDILVQSSKWKRDIIITGYVPDEVLAGLYKNAEAFVFPSLYEGFGIPILEAFQYGTPVACSNRAAIPEIAGNAAVYFDPTNVEEIAEVLDRLLGDENQRKYLANAGKERVTHFTWEEVARRTLNVYRRLMNS